MQFNELNIWSKLLLLTLVLAALYFPFFLHLDSPPIQQYDEALFAFRAYHIAEHGIPLKNFRVYDHIWTFPNSKPALFSYVQAIFYKIFGYSELALRLPVALSGVITCLYFIFICNKTFKNIYTGIFSSLVLCTSTGYMGVHMARFGDQDVPFALFSFLFAFNIYQFIKNKNKPSFIWAIIFFICAFLIKSVAVFLFIPGILVFIIIQGEILNFLKNNVRKLLIAAIFSLVIITAVALWDINQLIYILENYKRFSNEIDPYHSHGFWFYLEVLIDWGYFTPWIYLLPLSILPTISKNKYSNFLRYLWCLTFFNWLMISLAQTKIPHYASTLYIFLALITGISISWYFDKLINFLKVNSSIKSLSLFLITCLLLFSYPYTSFAFKNMYATEGDNRQLLSCLLKRRTEFKKATVVYDGYNFSNAFYINIRNREEGFQYRKIDSSDSSIEVQTAVFACENEDIEYLYEHFNLKIIDAQGQCGLFWLESQKY